jgi:hypothetical protein
LMPHWAGLLYCWWHTLFKDFLPVKRFCEAGGTETEILLSQYGAGGSQSAEPYGEDISGHRSLCFSFVSRLTASS